MKYYPICDDCVKGKGKECHTPGCVYCFNDVPSKMGIPEAGIDIPSIDIPSEEEILSIIKPIDSRIHGGFVDEAKAEAIYQRLNR